ncbi:MAG: SDR family NAD(P)-dependent oxidoreductase [Candidatus Thiodiazotropha endolucinida]|uniref:Benzil reductase ((S)-benzoin forming) n=1 Tax=Candidatus Thiodiazotropha endolucinida TaxID=1655433 RepID=A0A7Z0VMM7_9GAMM|nr:SDR family NAD(P)-dependent oxidoreductase [Candidatus Thiodiazotropha endolucinida]MBT3093467.1 SDR family NAD(P)-dependent oxidoreductase [Candidatus Thiodiazotropha sp. (ex Lucina pensylvanica)]MCG8023491.1 SDR family NAD(P)-dependent oxidoreductase [Candidatus Thiodiazotropha endolucinida]ODJ88056.1 benzil reductase ((S)-benzoin forming) [Candidatus Thiodiazotropha endolucinida]
MDKKNALITGNSSGLGLGLSKVLLARGYRIFGCSRRGCDLPGEVVDVHCDLTDFDAIAEKFEQLLQGIETLELVVLNAGILGEIKHISKTSLDELQQIMEINLWPNKIILDWLLQSHIKVDQILLLSSGAAILGNKGWGGYALSKCALNMLGRLYAHEFPATHIASIAPGLIESDMMDYLCTQADSEEYPALQRLRQARRDGAVLSPLQGAERILETLSRLKEFESGSYIDLRQILAPDEYQALIEARNRV